MTFCDRKSTGSNFIDPDGMNPKLHKGTVRCVSEPKSDSGELIMNSSLVRYTVFVCKLGSKMQECEIEESVKNFLEQLEAFNKTPLSITVKISKNQAGVSRGWGFIEIPDNDEACAILIKRGKLVVGKKEILMAEAVRQLPVNVVCVRSSVKTTSKNETNIKLMDTESQRSDTHSHLVPRTYNLHTSNPAQHQQPKNIQYISNTHVNNVTSTNLVPPPLCYYYNIGSNVLPTPPIAPQFGGLPQYIHPTPPQLLSANFPNTATLPSCSPACHPHTSNIIPPLRGYETVARFNTSYIARPAAPPCTCKWHLVYYPSH